MRTLLIGLILCAPVAAQAQTPTEAPAQTPSQETVDETLLDDREASDGDVPLPEKILEPPPPEAEPAVSIRTDSSGDVVEEYRLNGQIYMVKVRPERGVPYTLLDTNGDGRLDSQDGEGPVRPVYWTLYEWN
jgi:hypothetical protein